MSATMVNSPSQPGTAVLGGGMAWWVWTLSVIFVVYLFSFQTGYSIVNPSVQKDVGLTIAQVGAIAAVYTWVFAIFQFFGGALLDRIGSRRVLPVSIALVTIGIFIFANANNYGILLVSQIVVAIGSCTGFVGAGYIGGQWFGMAKFSFMFGLVQVVAALTSAFSVNLIGLALNSMTWRALFNATGVFGIVLFVVGLLYIKNPTPVVHHDGDGSGGFFTGVLKSMAEVAKIGHVWVASLGGALSFGAMLALGVVWMPKLLMVHRLSESAAGFGASLLWFGLAIGSAVIPHWSDVIKRRKLPIILGAAVQLAALLALVYLPDVGTAMAMTMCFIFGFANAAHMLAFSSAADVVQPRQIGTSAAIVNGIMFILGGVLISRPGVRIGLGVESGLQPASLPLAQYASLPLIIACVLALIVGLLMKETYPGSGH
ncbi:MULTISPECIES: MFS transporter [unclassified Dyella]|uniref:MFS transporter n=1 Tax=unclassified Dyella TaxID=2634549 RepID=UPI003F9300C3